MDRAKYGMVATLAVALAGYLTLTQPPDSRRVDGLVTATSALSAMHVSDDAMAVAGLVLLVCSNSGACAR